MNFFKYFFSIILLANISFAADTTVALKIPFKKTLSPQDVIIYGNQDIGFFKATESKIEKGYISIVLNPPTYKKEISFYLNNQNNLIFKKKFEKITNHPHDINIELKGSFSSPFFLVNLLSYETKKPSFFSAVINQFGEVVWFDKSHMRANRDLVASTNLNMVPWKNGVIIRGAGSNSFWSYVDWKGLEKSSLEKLEFLGLPTYAHHSMGSHSKEIFFWVSMTKTIPAYQDNIPVFSGIAGLIRGLGKEGRIILGSRLLALNPETKKIREVTNSFNLMNPKKAPSRSLDETIDRFQYANTVKDYNLFKSVHELETYVPFVYDTDWTHENAIDVDQKGNLLITIRNLNTVMKLSPNGKILWSIGDEYFSSHKLSNAKIEMGLPHAARFADNGDILIFDNSAPFRGMSKVNYESRILQLRLNDKGTVKLVNEIYLPGDKSLTKGSLRKMNNGNFLVWHPGPNTSPAQIFEVDKDGNFLSQLILNSLGYKKHEEVLPLSSIGDSVYNFQNAMKSKVLRIERGHEDVY